MQFLTYKVRCPETAADLTQEIYLRLARHPDVNGISNARAYLFTIANNLAIDYLRGLTRQSHRESEADTEALVCTKPQPDMALATTQQLEFLEQLIEGLPPKCREVFLLCRVEGKSYQEISAQLGISPRTVEAHMRKALDQIRKQYN